MAPISTDPRTSNLWGSHARAPAKMDGRISVLSPAFGRRALPNTPVARCQIEVPATECATRSGLMVFLEPRGTKRIVKDDRHGKTPRSVLGRVRRAAGVVNRDSFLNVRRDAAVVARRINEALENVNGMATHHAW